MDKDCVSEQRDKFLLDLSLSIGASSDEYMLRQLKEVSPEFWEGTRDLMIRHLRNNDLTGGIVAGVRQVGDLLHDKFPRQKDDENELPDEVACGQ